MGARISMNVQSTSHICMTGNTMIIGYVVLVTSARLTQYVLIPWEATNVLVNQVSMGMEDSVVKLMNVKLHELTAISMLTVLIKSDFMFANVNLVSGQIQNFQFY